MLLRRFLVACIVASCLFLLTPVPSAAPQDPAYDRDASAREYVQFLVLQLDQWTTEFPHQFNMAVMQPPVDASKLSENAKAAPGELGEAIKKLAALSNAKDLMVNAEFRSQLDKTLAAAKQVNPAMASQRFPARLQSDWDQIRSTLNNLARVYKVEALAVLDPPGGGGGGRGGRGGRGAPAAAGAQTAAAAPAVPGGLLGYLVDSACAKRGKGMWTNSECIARCLRDGDKIVLVTEEGKVYQIANPDKISPDSYGQAVTVVGKTEGETVTVESLR